MAEILNYSVDRAGHGHRVCLLRLRPDARTNRQHRGDCRHDQTVGELHFAFVPSFRLKLQKTEKVTRRRGETRQNTFLPVKTDGLSSRDHNRVARVDPRHPIRIRSEFFRAVPE
jgi:hypothetical protein